MKSLLDAVEKINLDAMPKNARKGGSLVIFFSLLNLTIF